MRFRRVRILASIVISGLVLIGNSVIAGAAENQPETPPEVVEFAKRIEDRFGIVIDRSAYEIRTEGQDGFIVHEDAPDLRVSSSRVGEAVRDEVSIVNLRPPTEEEAREQIENGLATVKQDVVWYEPVCYTRIEDEHGHMDACAGWGNMNYTNQTRNNWALRMWGTCWPHDDAWFTELDECHVATHPHTTPLVWNEYQPQSVQEVGGCGNVTLNVGVGPVSASLNVGTCDKLVPDPGDEPGEMRVKWIGDAYWDDDVRGTGLLISIGNAFGTTPYMDVSRAFIWSECNPPPSIIDECG